METGQLITFTKILLRLLNWKGQHLYVIFVARPLEYGEIKQLQTEVVRHCATYCIVLTFRAKYL